MTEPPVELIKAGRAIFAEAVDLVATVDALWRRLDALCSAEAILTEGEFTGNADDELTSVWGDATGSIPALSVLVAIGDNLRTYTSSESCLYAGMSARELREKFAHLLTD